MKFFTPLVVVLSVLLAWAEPLRAESLLKPEDRIVFVGDSITGQGGNIKPDGWVALIGGALKEQDTANRQTLVALGGSGQTVGGWLNVEKKSRTAPAFLDVKAFDVQAELNQHADVVVIMLGMNDVLAPSMKDTEDGVQHWVDSYRVLIETLRKRTTARVVAVCTPTPCTEGVDGPKNRVMDKMCAALAKLAAEEKCPVLPTRATDWEVFGMGRRVKPDFHITVDQVHPNPFGHLAIAAGMLRGLGEEGAAERLLARVKDGLTKLADGQAVLSYEVALLSQETPVTGDVRLQVRVYHAAGKATLELPAGWTILDTKEGAGESVFIVDAVPDRLVNRFTVRSGELSREVTVPAPWWVGTGNGGWRGWKAGVFDDEAGKLAGDEAVRTGVDFTKMAAGMEVAPGVPVVWKPLVGGVNYGGAGAPGVVDFASATYFSGGETGYGLRWIKSDKDRAVVVKVWRPGFAGTSHLSVWLNGAVVYAGSPEKARGMDFPAKLKAGWNLLSFKSNFQQWQWQLAVDLSPVAGDSLEALRFSIVPR